MLTLHTSIYHNMLLINLKLETTEYSKSIKKNRSLHLQVQVSGYSKLQILIL